MKKSGEKEKMFKKIFKFAAGCVIIKISGSEKERFVNMCMYNALRISNVIPCDGYLLATLQASDFCKLRRIVRKSGVSVKIISKHGLRFFLKRNRKRYGFAAAILFGVFLIIAPQYIWCVEIDGAYSADTQEIKEILKKHGVYAGAKKSEIGKLSDIKTDIVASADGVNWAWLYVEGARARLQIQEELPSPEVVDANTPTDIIAITDGWVERADVMRGERKINTEMNVTEGQMLVSGKVALFKEGEPEKYMYVHSKAKIIADTVRTESGFFTGTETLRIKTGNKKTYLTVNLSGKELNLFKSVDGGFEEYDVESKRYDIIGYMGVSITVHTVYEVNVATNELSEEEILARAKEQLEERICRKLQTGAVKNDEELTYSAENGVYKVTLRMHLKENIGMEIPTEE